MCNIADIGAGEYCTSLACLVLSSFSAAADACVRGHERDRQRMLQLTMVKNRYCFGVCLYVSGSRHDAIFGGLITARCVDARRSLVFAGDAVVARRVDARRCLVLSGDAIACPQHMWCVCVCVFVCVCKCEP